MGSVGRKQEVITHLTTYYSDFTDDAAGRIYDEATNLYHESLTYTNFNLLLERDEKIISALVTIIIFEIDLDKLKGLHGQIMMFILFSYKTIAPTYVFVQAIGHYVQDDGDVIQSTKLLRIILDSLYDYVNKSKIDSLNSHSHLFKSFNRNLNLLEQQRKEILEDFKKQEEAKKFIESDVEAEIKKIMFIDYLPHNILYHLCKYLSFIDIINLSKTCKQLYILTENDNYFWMMLIKNHFGFKLYKRYVHEIFYNEKNSDYVLYRTNKDKEKFEKYFEINKLFLVCITWVFNMLNCKDSIDGYLAYKSLMKQKKHPRTNDLRMSLTIEEVFDYYLKRNNYLTKENILQISFYKLIYFYLIELKRLVAVNLFGIHLHCSKDHLNCINRLYPKQEDDLTSSIGRCVRLYTVRSQFLVGIRGKFKSIWPGIYEIICRIKLDKNEEYLTFYNEYCSRAPGSEKNVQCYFYALAGHGLDCECNRKKMNFNWFESKYLLYGNQNWFNETMGKIKVFELSDIYFGFQIKNEYCYRNILLDYVQLNIVE
ncbi:unnamed protein product [Rotaria sordida]|uniref:F-box domain-containing protein n=1 Tax=Rotaria sordida TaxID=392033 RepID=A0A815QWB5_9BILA|nr:unnamed protein product [Rotaria sordida]